MGDNPQTIEIHTDGGARGNPGPASIGVVITQGQQTLTEIKKRIGNTTNNVAEYRAVTEALDWLGSQKQKGNISFFLDSNLVVNQLNGRFKVKDAKLRELLMSIRMKEQHIPGVITYTYIPREENRRADALVNQALDES